MTEPTDRERVAWILCKHRFHGKCSCETKRTDGACLIEAMYADAAIALGAKPPGDPFQKLMGEVMEVWAYQRPIIAPIGPNEVTAMENIARHVLARAKELGL